MPKNCKNGNSSDATLALAHTHAFPRHGYLSPHPNARAARQPSGLTPLLLGTLRISRIVSILVSARIPVPRSIVRARATPPPPFPALALALALACPLRTRSRTPPGTPPLYCAPFPTLFISWCATSFPMLAGRSMAHATPNSQHPPARGLHTHHWLDAAPPHPHPGPHERALSPVTAPRTPRRASPCSAPRLAAYPPSPLHRVLNGKNPGHIPARRASRARHIFVPMIACPPRSRSLFVSSSRASKGGRTSPDLVLEPRTRWMKGVLDVLASGSPARPAAAGYVLAPLEAGHACRTRPPGLKGREPVSKVGPASWKHRRRVGQRWAGGERGKGLREGRVERSGGEEYEGRGGEGERGGEEGKAESGASWVKRRRRGWTSEGKGGDEEGGRARVYSYPGRGGKVAVRGQGIGDGEGRRGMRRGKGAARRAQVGMRSGGVWECGRKGRNG
ncbi:hypothetical protein C8R47DRAFT_1079055 [Mycena vitilis]|nr:hypothetical protein C8R47DRAFT_1079055 [Mycena vitilis]